MREGKREEVTNNGDIRESEKLVIYSLWENLNAACIFNFQNWHTEELTCKMSHLCLDGPQKILVVFLNPGSMIRGEKNHRVPSHLPCRYWAFCRQSSQKTSSCTWHMETAPGGAEEAERTSQLWLTSWRQSSESVVSRGAELEGDCSVVLQGSLLLCREMECPKSLWFSSSWQTMEKVHQDQARASAASVKPHLRIVF